MASDLKIRLSGGLPKTGSWIGINAAGQLEVELFDYSPSIEGSWGVGPAFMVTVAPEHWPVLWQRLHGKANPPRQVKPEPLLEAIRARFDSYSAVKGWLEQQGIPFQTRVDSQA